MRQSARARTLERLQASGRFPLQLICQRVVSLEKLLILEAFFCEQFIDTILKLVNG